MAVTWRNEREFYTAIKRMTRDLDYASRDVLEQGSRMLISAAMNNFQGSHAPGEPHVGGNRPNIVTGNLRRSIQADSVVRLGVAYYSVTIAPRMVYGRRVEFGFNGSDSRGREYEARGYPYMEPALRSVLPRLNDLHKRTFGKIFKK